jgi:putative ABC transport system permease protein
MFALTDPYLLRSLPYVRPEELVSVSVSSRGMTGVPTLADWRARTDLFAAIAGYGDTQILTVRTTDGERTLRVAPISVDFFKVLGLPVQLPDDWFAAENSSSASPVLLTANAAGRLFNTAPAVGAQLPRDEGGPLRVSGVLPRTFRSPYERTGQLVEGFIPLGDPPLIQAFPSDSRTSSVRTVAVLGRLQRGIAPLQLQNLLTRLSPQRSADIAAGDLKVTAELLSTTLTKPIRSIALGALLAGLMILFACAANIASLFLARGAFRAREFSTRLAIGAPRRSLAALILAELAFLTAVGIVGGLGIARVALAFVELGIPARFISLGAPAITWRVAVFAILGGMIVVLAGFVPAWTAWRLTPPTLSRSPAIETTTLRTFRYWTTVAQTATATLLLIGAALLSRSHFLLTAQDPGYSTGTFAVRARYPTGHVGDPLRQDIENTVERLGHLNGVVGAAAVDGTLADGLSNLSASGGLVVNGHRVRALTKMVTSGFFSTSQCRLVTGRWPTPDDFTRSIVFTTSLAQACCGTHSPLGLVVQVGDQPLEVIAVIKDVFVSALDQPPGPTAYVALNHPRQPWINYVVRMENPDTRLAVAFEREILAVNRHAAVDDIETMRARLMRSIDERTFATVILLLFAVAAVGVSVVGIVGVVSSIVARRTREIAIRVTLGASRRHVLWIVMRDAVSAAAAGAFVGLILGGWLSRMVQNLLYRIRPADPLSLTFAALLIATIVGVAAWLPARQALRFSPLVTLRSE